MYHTRQYIIHLHPPHVIMENIKGSQSLIQKRWQTQKRTIPLNHYGLKRGDTEFTASIIWKLENLIRTRSPLLIIFIGDFVKQYMGLMKILAD